MDDARTTPADDRWRARFDRLADAAAPSVAPPSVDGLLDRSRRRRRRRARRVGGAALAVSLLVAGVAAAGTDDHDDRAVHVTVERSTTTGGSTTTSAPPLPAGPDVLTVGVVPNGLAFEGCGAPNLGIDPVVSCRLTIPTTFAPDGITVTRWSDPAEEQVVEAFEGRNASGAKHLTVGDRGSAPRFLELGGRSLLDLGIGDRIGGMGVLPDRVSRSFEFLLDGHLVQLMVEGVPEAELGEVVAGLAMAPLDGRLVVPQGLLPDDVHAIGQGPRPRWIQPDPLQPERSSLASGSTVGADYAVVGRGTGLLVERSTGIDVAEFFEQLLADPATAGRAIEAAGHRAIAFDDLAPADLLPPPRDGVQILVDLGDGALLRVVASGRTEGGIEEVATALAG